MFEQLFSNGKFKPLTEHRLKSMLSDEEIERLPKELPFKVAVRLARGDISEEDLYCHCGNMLSERGIFKRMEGKDVSCSKSCATKITAEKRRKTIIERYGGEAGYSSHVKRVQLTNSIERYGVPFQSTPQYRDKVKSTLIRKYGVDHNSKIDDVKESRLVLDGNKLVDPLNTRQSKEKAKQSKDEWSHEKRDYVAAKISSSKKKASTVDHLVLDNIDKRIPSFELAENANCSLMTAWRALKSKGLMEINYTQNTVMDFVKSLGFECYSTRKVIAPYEIDIYIPEKKLAIEYNGLYWHSSGSKEDDAKMSKYHLMKTDMCEEKGIQLLHIFENEWVDPIKREIWKSVIRHKLGLSKRIYARKCTKKEISYNEANAFCASNHLQGACIGGNKCIGLFHRDELVQVAIFGKSRYRKNDTELFRLCSKLNTIIVGGASKLVKGINFISYGNRRWCSILGNVYNELATLEGISSPCYWYMHKGELYHRSSYMKHKLPNLLENYDPSLTEVENCYNNGLRRIWDSGNLIYRSNNVNNF